MMDFHHRSPLTTEEAELLGVQVEATTVPATLPFTGAGTDLLSLVGGPKH